jgi:cullin-associated NEDD8-dissociated protein 1
MATNDLCQELSSDLVLDSAVESKICAAVIKQLDDASNDVQSIAVKCLSILVKKVQEPQVVDICDKLCSAILSGKDALRDIYSIGLKTCISGIPSEMGPAVATRVTPRLLTGASNDDESAGAVKLECLDLLTDLLSRFGSSMGNEHGKMSQVVLKQLNNAKPVVRKRATACVGQVSWYDGMDMFA